MDQLITKNRINEAFDKKEKVLNIYFTAGYPDKEDTLEIAANLEEAGADMLEIGIPFSDPVADGPTIQESSKVALDNGMTLSILFEQLSALRESVQIPVLLMGYVNPIIQFGIEKFCQKCADTGIDGVIIPDLPMQEYLDDYSSLFAAHGIHNIFLITPNTSEERIQLIDEHSEGFIYMVSSSSTTGAKETVHQEQLSYFNRVRNMKLKNPRLIGFGISNKETFDAACEHADGAIIGSAFINQLKKNSEKEHIKTFIQSIKNQ